MCVRVCVHVCVCVCLSSLANLLQRKIFPDSGQTDPAHPCFNFYPPPFPLLSFFFIFPLQCATWLDCLIHLGPVAFQAAETDLHHTEIWIVWATLCRTVGSVAEDWIACHLRFKCIQGSAINGYRPHGTLPVQYTSGSEYQVFGNNSRNRVPAFGRWNSITFRFMQLL